jgi:hypothetical protein
VLNELFKKIDYTADNARNNGFSELIEDNIISLAFARDDQKHLLKTWTIEKNIRSKVEVDHDVSDSSFVGPPLPIDEVKRIKHKIEDKKRQLDRKSLNVLVIRADHLYLPTHIAEYINALRQLVYDHDYLAILIVVGGHPGGLYINDTTKRNDDLYLVRSTDFITKEILILTNKYSKDTAKTLSFSSKIKTAFENCTTFLY